MDLAITAVGLLGALGIGSMLSQIVASTGARRAVRADVLTSLGVVEERRWSTPGDSGENFRAACHRLQTTAIMARLPRSPIRCYLVLAQISYWSSREAIDLLGWSEETARIVEHETGALAAEAAANVALVVWAPLVRRRRSIHQAEALLTAARDSVPDGALRRRLDEAESYVF